MYGFIILKRTDVNFLKKYKNILVMWEIKYSKQSIKKNMYWGKFPQQKIYPVCKELFWRHVQFAENYCEIDRHVGEVFVEHKSFSTVYNNYCI